MYFRAALLLVAMSLSACSMFQRKSTAQMKEYPTPAVTPATPAEEKATAADKERAEEIRKTVAVETAKQAAKAVPEEIHADHHTVPADHKPREVGPVPAEKSLGWLKNGNTRFVTGRLRADGAKSADRTRLAAGQKPHAIVLSCSDSRVPPELVFDQKLGEVFVVRTAGESLDNNVIGSIEYAVDHLGSNLIVVMGHSSCGAVKAALASLQGSDLGSPALNGLVADLKPHLTQYANKKSSEGLVEEVSANVNGVAHDLLARSQILRDAMATGEVKIVRAVYHLETGKVDWLE
jgi:carbonic anhydrase